MTWTPVHTSARESLPDASELLIKEARREAHGRRLRIVAVVVIVFVTAIVIWLVSDGGPRVTTPARVATSTATSGKTTGGVKNSLAAITPGQSVMSIAPFGANTLWAPTQNETALKGGGQGIEETLDAGHSWTNATPPGLGLDGGDHFATGFFALSATRAWMTYGGVSDRDRQTLETTDNAGRTWSKVGVLPPTGCEIQFVSSEVGTCTDLQGALGSMSLIIYRSNDDGASWQKVFDNTAVAAPLEEGSIPFGCDKRVNFTNATKGFALFFCNGGSGAVIYETLDGGRTWLQRNVTQPPSILEGGGGFSGPLVLDGMSGAVAYEIGDESSVYVTHNGGVSFQPVYPPGKAQPWSVDIVSPSVWRLSHGNDILATNNAGRTWFRVKSDLVLEADRFVQGAPPGGTVEFATKNDGWFLEDSFGSNPQLLRTTDGGRHWTTFAVPGTEKLRHHT